MNKQQENVWKQERMSYWLAQLFIIKKIELAQLVKFAQLFKRK